MRHPGKESLLLMMLNLRAAKGFSCFLIITVGNLPSRPSLRILFMVALCQENGIRTKIKKPLYLRNISKQFICKFIFNKLLSVTHKKIIEFGDNMQIMKTLKGIPNL